MVTQPQCLFGILIILLPISGLKAMDSYILESWLKAARANSVKMRIP
jgi:hypothetical protein